MELHLPLQTVGAAEVAGADTRIVDRDGAHVALVGTRLCGAIEAEERAAFFVKAANAHGGLLELAAEAMYERGRRDVSGRPRWDKLNPDEPYDMGMKQAAREMALAEALTKAGEQS